MAIDVILEKKKIFIKHLKKKNIVDILSWKVLSKFKGKKNPIGWSFKKIVIIKSQIKLKQIICDLNEIEAMESHVIITSCAFT